MRNVVLWALAGLVAGFAALHLFGGAAPDAPLAALPPAPRAAAPPAAPVSSALRLVEAPAERPALREPAREEPGADELANREHEPRPTVDRVDGLVAVGFTAARAAQILQREAELRQAGYAAEFTASGTVRPFGTAARSGAAAELRAELGDADYERYLEGTGQPRSVVVRAVETDSAAAHAGLLPGDEIRAYAGQRVFNQRDLNALMLAGTPGEVVATTVVRDGQTLQLYVTRGPLGLM